MNIKPNQDHTKSTCFDIRPAANVVRNVPFKDISTDNVIALDMWRAELAEADVERRRQELIRAQREAEAMNRALQYYERKERRDRVVAFVLAPFHVIRSTWRLIRSAR